MAVVENGSSQDANDETRFVKLQQFQTPIQSQTHISTEQGDHQHNHPRSTAGNEGEDGFKKEMRELEEMFSKLNPMAREFVPPSLVNNPYMNMQTNGAYFAESIGAANLMYLNGYGNNRNMARRGKKNGYSQTERRMSTRTGMTQRDDVIKRTVYITEEQLAALFLGCGQVVYCRVCGDPNSVLRFAFVEFTDEESARAALKSIWNHAWILPCVGAAIEDSHRTC
ncbi:Poly(A) RNA polymerase cid13 [Orobanche gracilis]